MAQIEDRKSSFYSQKQSVRDELSAPQYLESAGDVLVKELAKKQTNTRTTLQEQLEIVQNFEKGFEITPEVQKGITSLREFQSRVETSEDVGVDKAQKSEEIEDVDELMTITGLSRHELELSLCEKPNSTKAQLYKFAITNKRQKRKHDLESQLPDHPINKLKEIEEECFGHLKKGNASESEKTKGEEKNIGKKKRGKRKRKKKGKGNDGSTEEKREDETVETVADVEDDVQKATTSRVSLWDVRDMKRWSESKQYGCAPRKYYTIKDGKIVQI